MMVRHFLSSLLYYIHIGARPLNRSRTSNLGLTDTRYGGESREVGVCAGRLFNTILFFFIFKYIFRPLFNPIDLSDILQTGYDFLQKK